MSLRELSERLSREVSALRFAAPVEHVYNPLDYAAAPHRLYLERYGGGSREVILLGMNPGPFGMAQTGVPFGDVSMVRDFLRIEAKVEAPARVHAKRPVLGFACPRREVSGTRLWGWIRAAFGSPQAFFSRFFVANYCPLAFVDAGGRNLTPDKLQPRWREPLLAICDAALRGLVEHLSPRLVVGVGTFAETRARLALAGLPIEIGRLAHPSPASPAANRNWAALATSDMRRLGVAWP